MSANSIRKKYRSVSSDNSGAAAIEFALVAPVLILILAGIMAYALYFGAAHAVQQIAADAARASVAGLTDGERTQLASAHVSANGRSYLMLRPSKLAVAAGPRGGDPSQFDVRVTFDSSDLPIWCFEGLLPLPDKTIVRTATIKRGGY